MLEQIGTVLFPDEALSPAGRRLRMAALLLFPLALIAGFALLVFVHPPPAVPTNINRSQAIQIARDFAVRQGIPAQNWTSKVNYTVESSRLTFVNEKRERLPIWQVAPPLAAGITLKSGNKDEAFLAAISVDGRVVGYEWKNPTLPPGADQVPEPASREAATRQIASLPGEFKFGSPSLSAKDEDRTYTYHSSAIRDVDVRAEVKLRGSRIVHFVVKAEPADEAEESSQTRLQTALTVFGVCFVCLISIYSIYRYVSRTLQQEVSHRRSLVVALLCGVFCVLIGANALVNTGAGELPLGVMLIVFAILGLMGGALLAAGYGSGEGDIREAFPGKLTSLDALLSGKFYSRNVGASILFGIGFAAWLSLLLGVLSLLFRVREPQGSEEQVAPFMQYRVLMPLVTYPLLSLSFGAAGLLQPLAFLQRHAKRFRRFQLPLLILSAVLVSSVRNHARSTGEFVVTSGVVVAALLLPFFELDLLASLVCVTTLISHIAVAGALAAVPAYSMASVATHLGAMLVFTVFALAGIRNGRICSEEQVRPLYAKHIAERKSLEAEVSAAREAQLRLLPENTPEIAGLSIAAICLPAETVGGDFYDFFPLGDGRLGVFIAEGNRGGLAAALTIALAKGYLMHSVSRSGEPVEILSRLEIALGSILNPAEWESGEDEVSPALTEFAFAAIDTAAGEIRYARTAAYPKVVVVSANGAGATERMVPVKGRATPIAEGWAVFHEGDQLLLFTDGIGRRLASGNRRPDDVAAALAREGKDTEHVRHSVLAYSASGEEPDDLTLVVIRANAEAFVERDAALGVVA